VLADVSQRVRYVRTYPPTSSTWRRAKPRWRDAQWTWNLLSSEHCALPGVVTRLRTDDQQILLHIPAEAIDFPLLPSFQTVPVEHAACYAVGSKGSFLSGKAAGTWSWALATIQFWF